MRRRLLFVLRKVNMTEQNSALSQEEMDFKVWQKAAWEEVEQFRETAEDYFGENNPQHRLAAEFFQMGEEARLWTMLLPCGEI